jgi:hypothetical protein
MPAPVHERQGTQGTWPYYTHQHCDTQGTLPVRLLLLLNTRGQDLNSLRGQRHWLQACTTPARSCWGQTQCCALIAAQHAGWSDVDVCEPQNATKNLQDEWAEKDNRETGSNHQKFKKFETNTNNRRRSGVQEKGTCSVLRLEHVAHVLLRISVNNSRKNPEKEPVHTVALGSKTHLPVPHTSQQAVSACFKARCGTETTVSQATRK